MSSTCPQCGGLIGHSAQKVALTLQMAGQRAFACQGHPEPDPRDVQFAGYAKALFDDLKNKSLITLADHPDWDRMLELQEKIDTLAKQTIAHRDYDLVSHTLNHAPLTEWECDPWEIPDMTTWPEESKH